MSEFSNTKKKSFSFASNFVVVVFLLFDDNTKQNFSVKLKCETAKHCAAMYIVYAAIATIEQCVPPSFDLSFRTSTTHTIIYLNLFDCTLSANLRPMLFIKWATAIAFRDEREIKKQ